MAAAPRGSEPELMMASGLGELKAGQEGDLSQLGGGG